MLSNKPKINFNVEFHVPSKVTHVFTDGEYDKIDKFEDYPKPISGSITDDEDNNIGSIFAYLLPNTCDFFEKCDAESGDCYTIASVICGNDGSVEMFDEFTNVFILDKIEISEKYRNSGIGTAIMKTLPKMLKYEFEFVEAIFLYASDFNKAKVSGFDSHDYKEGSEKLIEFYKRCGYKIVKDNVMFCDMRNMIEILKTSE